MPPKKKSVPKGSPEKKKSPAAKKAGSKSPVKKSVKEAANKKDKEMEQENPGSLQTLVLEDEKYPIRSMIESFLRHMDSGD